MSKIQVEQSKLHGKGLMATRDIEEGEFLGYVSGPIVEIRNFTKALSKKTLDWIGVGRYTWINTDKSIFRYINHSCNPNSALVSKRTVRAIKPIKKGEEVTMDYSLTEAEEGWYINCKCKSKNCRHKILRISELPKNIFEKNKKNIPNNFVKIYEVDNGKSVIHKKHTVKT